jgi:hypothetical protein
MNERPRGRLLPASRRGGQSPVLAACVALGCWGFAFGFAFFTTGSDHYVYGGMAAVLALMWSVLFAMRLRRRLQQG